MMVTNFYNKIAQECPYRKSAVLVYGQKQPVKVLEKLVSKTVCGSDNIDCIERLCKNCSVNMLKEIEVNIKYCSYDCKHNNELCDSHTIVFHQFKQSNYKNKKGETKKLV